MSATPREGSRDWSGVAVEYRALPSSETGAWWATLAAMRDACPSIRPPRASLLSIETSGVMREPGRRIDKVFVVLDGEAYSFKAMPGRARQIVDIAVRGEALNVAGLYRDEGTVGFGSFGPCTLLALPKASLRRLLRADERLRESFDRMIADEVAALTDRLASIGRQPALQRLAAFALRQAMRRGGAAARDGQGVPRSFATGITQQDLADILGMSAVHLARNLGVLKDGEILRMRRGLVELLDIPALARLAGVELAARPSQSAVPRRAVPAVAAMAS